MTRTLQLAWATLRPRRAIPGQAVLTPSVTRLRVHLGDLDLFRHVNNGVYLQMMDVGRANFLADLGAYATMSRLGWYPVVAASTMTYRRSLTLGQRVDLVTRVLGWDPRVIYLEQSFWRGEERVARGLVAGRFLSRAGERIAGTDVVAQLGGDLPSPDLPEDAATWARAVGVAHRPA